MSEDEYCTRCKFFKPEVKDTGECRRHSPQALAVVESQVDGGTVIFPASTVWPGVSVNDWCGDFQIGEKP